MQKTQEQLHKSKCSSFKRQRVKILTTDTRSCNKSDKLMINGKGKRKC